MRYTHIFTEQAIKRRNQYDYNDRDKKKVTQDNGQQFPYDYFIRDNLNNSSNNNSIDNGTDFRALNTTASNTNLIAFCGFIFGATLAIFMIAFCIISLVRYLSRDGASGVAQNLSCKPQSIQQNRNHHSGIWSRPLSMLVRTKTRQNSQRKHSNSSSILNTGSGASTAGPENRNSYHHHHHRRHHHHHLHNHHTQSAQHQRLSNRTITKFAGSSSSKLAMTTLLSPRAMAGTPQQVTGTMLAGNSRATLTTITNGGGTLIHAHTKTISRNNFTAVLEKSRPGALPPIRHRSCSRKLPKGGSRFSAIPPPPLQAPHPPQPKASMYTAISPISPHTATTLAANNINTTTVVAATMAGGGGGGVSKTISSPRKRTAAHPTIIAMLESTKSN